VCTQKDPIFFVTKVTQKLALADVHLLALLII